MNKKTLLKTLIILNIAPLFAGGIEDEFFGSIDNHAVNNVDNGVDAGVLDEIIKDESTVKLGAKIYQDVRHTVVEGDEGLSDDDLDQEDISDQDEGSDLMKNILLSNDIQFTGEDAKEDKKIQVAEKINKLDEKKKEQNEYLHNEIIPKMINDHFILLGDESYFGDKHWNDWYNLLHEDVEYVRKVLVSTQAGLASNRTKLKDLKARAKATLASIKDDRHKTKNVYKTNIQKINETVQKEKEELAQYEEVCNRIKESALDEYKQTCKREQGKLDALKAQNLKFLKNIAQLNEERLDDIKKATWYLNQLNKDVTNTTNEYNRVKSRHDSLQDSMSSGVSKNDMKKQEQLQKLDVELREKEMKKNAAIEKYETQRPQLVSVIAAKQNEIQELNKKKEEHNQAFDVYYKKKQTEVLGVQKKALEKKDQVIAKQAQLLAEKAAKTTVAIQALSMAKCGDKSSISDTNANALNNSLDDNFKEICSIEAKIISLKHAEKKLKRRLIKEQEIKKLIEDIRKYREDVFANNLHKYVINPKKITHRKAVASVYGMTRRLYKFLDKLEAYNMISSEDASMYKGNIKIYKQHLNKLIVLPSSTIERGLLFISDFYKKNERPLGILAYNTQHPVDLTLFKMENDAYDIFRGLMYQVSAHISIIDENNLTEVDTSVPYFERNELKNTTVERLIEGDKREKVFAVKNMQHLARLGDDYNKRRVESVKKAKKEAKELMAGLKASFGDQPVTSSGIEGVINNLQQAQEDKNLIRIELKQKLGVNRKSEHEYYEEGGQIQEQGRQLAGKCIGDLATKIEEIKKTITVPLTAQEEFENESVVETANISSNRVLLVKDHSLIDNLSGVVFGECTTTFLVINNTWQMKGGLIFKGDSCAKIYDKPVCLAPLFGFYNSQYKVGADVNFFGCPFGQSKFLNLELRILTPWFVMISFVFDRQLKPSLRIGGRTPNFDYSITQMPGWIIPLNFNGGMMIGKKF